MKDFEEYKLVVMLGCENYIAEDYIGFYSEFETNILYEESTNMLFFVTKHKRVIAKLFKNVKCENVKRGWVRSHRTTAIQNVKMWSPCAKFYYIYFQNVKM